MLNKLVKLREFFYKYPPIGLELSQCWAGLIKLQHNKGMPKTASYCIKQIPEGLIPSDLNIPSDLKIEEVKQLVSSMLKECSIFAKRISLVIPDNIARIMIFNDLPKMPRSRKAILELIKWKMEKKLSFKLQEAIIDFQLISTPIGKGVMAIVAPANLIRQFEEVFSALKIQAGLIIPSSFAMVNFYYRLLCQNGSAEDRFFINMSDYYISFFILRGKKLLLFRTKNLRSGERGKKTSFSHLIDQARLTLLYYQDHLQGEKELKVYLGGISPELRNFKSILEKELKLTEVLLIPVDCSQFTNVSIDDEYKLIQLSAALGAALGI